MPQIIEFEGQRHEFPDDFTQADIRRALSSLPPASQMHDVSTSERRFPMVNGTVAVPASQPKAVTDPALIAQLEGSPAAKSPGMFDDLIPKKTGRTFNFTSPEGKSYTVTGPDGASPEQAFAILQQQLKVRPPAQAAPTQPKLVPVDHDPFAAPAPAAPGVGAQNAAAAGRLYVTPEPPKPIERPASILPSSVGGAVRDFQVGAQGVGKGLTDIVTGIPDLVAGAQNAATGGINRLFGTNIPYAIPASKLVEKAVDASGIPVIDPATMSRSEKLAYDVNRFGTQAVGTGAMLAQRAPQVAEAVVPSETFMGRVLDRMARPYAEAPARTLVGDAIGGMGAGVAVNASDNYVPNDAIVFGHHVGHGLKNVANVIAPLVGASGANTLQSGVESLGGLIRNMASKTFTSAPAPIPLNPTTKAPYSNADVDRAAARLQSAATGAPRALAQDIRENAAALASLDEGTALHASAMPTSGLLSRDPGLIAAEQAARLKSSPDFVKRDQNVKAAAAERVEAVRDPGADLSSVMRRAAEARAERVNAAESDVLQRQDALNSIDQIRHDQGQPLSGVANSEARADASRRLDRALVEQTYLAARTEKNRLFDTAPGRNDQLPADDVFGAIDRIRGQANDLAPGTLPEDFMRRLDALRPVIDPETGTNLGGPGTALGGDLADLRKFIGPAQQQAQARGNFDLADNLGRLRAAINRTIEEAPGYSEANANYQQFAERFRPEPNDPGAKFTKAIDRGGQNADGELNRGATPPGDTAGRFLASPESAATLPRMLQGSPAMTAAETALRDHYRSSLAMSALNADGTINPIRASAWANSHAEILAQFPAIRREFDDIVAQARRGEQLSMQARADLEAARTARNATEAEVDRSAIGTLIREDPRDAATKILNGGYDSSRRLDEINALMKNDAQAQRGWKAAMSEVLADKVQGTRQVGETLEVQFARLAKEFKDNEQLIAKVFSPEEMSNLRQAHKILSYFKEAEKRASVGSDTAEKINIPGWAQLAVRHFKGDLAGGGLIKRFKLLLEMLPSNKQNADEIIHLAWFDPNVAAYLLERPVKNPDVPRYNIDLRRLIAAANAARDN
ncbi:hypothetical protein A5906_07395 [Bradyrhizobium sacchari]|uniref:hypothetical protein n=1 Tax=Bradyrhizobium sacchari TaxID=1399419 RepID=UPI0009D4D9A4|nr:hypothetical protein [Bradyrhizobium sacchari]OPY95783.1 hypothetical protein A5906_07395 [Bradyrhizobium sacchari]TWB66653.1 hypothetical protein FBZ94_101329 [Bradyrhizobium sacchari]